MRRRSRRSRKGLVGLGLAVAACGFIGRALADSYLEAHPEAAAWLTAADVFGAVSALPPEGQALWFFSQAGFAVTGLGLGLAGYGLLRGR